MPVSRDNDKVRGVLCIEDDAQVISDSSWKGEGGTRRERESSQPEQLNCARCG